MSAIERFSEAARALGLDPKPRRFPEGTKTAEDAARAVGCDVGQIVKSLVFMADDAPVLAITSGANRVDEGRLAALAGASSVRRASPEDARSATGFAVGGTPPFVIASRAEEGTGDPSRVRVYVDEDLLRYEEIWAAAGTPDSVFRLTPQELVRASRGEVASFAER
jgi:prolyl-tRNA editing enzyme YbaK/EbsC (Cys-tRNA(Pro) deacylase)